MKIDRIIVQRAVCHGTLCNYLGSVESYYKGYFTAILTAGNQPDVPVYMRWSWHEKAVSPVFFSPTTADNYNKVLENDPEKKKPIGLQPNMCFDELVTRLPTDYGRIPTVSAESVQKFKKVAYGLVASDPSLTTYFTTGPPFRILVSFRGPKATRHTANLMELVSALEFNFPPPSYVIRLMNNSNPYLDYKTQLHAVAESHIVITNHGAFEGNMIYMKNSSLLLELFGTYGNNEIHTFHRLALMFGVFYARMNPSLLLDHQQPTYNLTQAEIAEVVDHVKNYFSLKPYLINSGPP